MLNEVKQYFFNFINRKAKYALVEHGNLSVHRYFNLKSRQLGRKIWFDVYLPPRYDKSKKEAGLLFLNDGQDMEKVGLVGILQHLYRENAIQPLVIVAIHAGDRMQEYGVQRQADYAGRGRRAWAYSRFLVGELRPYILRHYACVENVYNHGIAGFSLGGLSALDIGWTHSDLFKRIGVFSGALWWRYRAFNPRYPDAHRLMHEIIGEGVYKSGLKFWFQTGTNDEKSDRNNNGVIDSIDDTLDLMNELVSLGYDDTEDMKYFEVEGGFHNQQTWGYAMPFFLKWAFGVKKNVAV